MSSLDDLFGTGSGNDATQDPTFAILGLVPAPTRQLSTPPGGSAPSASNSLRSQPDDRVPLTRRQLRELERAAERAALPAREQHGVVAPGSPAVETGEPSGPPVQSIFGAGAARVASAAGVGEGASAAAEPFVPLVVPSAAAAPVAPDPDAATAFEELSAESVVSGEAVGWLPGGTPEAALIVPPLEAETNARRRARAKKRFRRAGGRLVVIRSAGSARPAARGRTPLRRLVVRKLMTVGAMVGAGLMMISTSVPANAFYTEPAMAAEAVSEEAPDEVQALRVASGVAEVVEDAPTLSRDNYTVVSLAEQIFLKYGNRNFAFTNNPDAAIQWPFPIGVPISSGFGERIAPCSFCSSNHQGVDFTPGAGTPIQAIADGTVILVAANNYGWGNHVIIRHQIDGQQVDSLYAHMAFGSIAVVEGQTVRVTDIVGRVGSTGASTGAHLHLEIHVNGVAIDPFEWLKAHNK